MQDKSLYNMSNASVDSVISTNKVLRNTYMLLGLTLLFKENDMTRFEQIQISYAQLGDAIARRRHGDEP